MATSRATSNRLLRLLRGAPQPIYVLDPQRTILFCNEELAAWLGLESQAIIGQQLDYDAAGDADSTTVSLAGLAPAPEAIDGDVQELLVSRETADHNLVYRRAQLLPLGNAEVPGGTIIVLESTDLSPAELAAAKPISKAALYHEQIRQFRVSQQSRFALAHTIGNSPAMNQARRAAKAATACGASVVILGPPGSGRSHVARSIHYEASDSRQRFLPLACELLDADELLQTLRRNRDLHDDDEVAITWMFADVDRLPLDAQLILEQELAATNASWRILATAAQPLIELAAEETRFRIDLARLLTTIEIRLPPLSQRLDDLPLLAQVFLEEENSKSTRQIGSVSPEALRTLAEHSWPGNLDELRDVVRSAHQACTGSRIEQKHLSLRMRQAALAASVPRPESPTVNLEDFLGEIEAELIERALRQAQGNKTRAAELLGMTRPRFYRRLEQLGLLSESDAHTDL